MRGDIAKANSLIKKDININQVGYSTIISYFSKMKHYMECWNIFEIAQKKGLADLFTYTKMIQICDFEYNYSKSRALFKEASELFQLDTQIYNAHIGTLSKSIGTSEEALSVWKLMKSKGVVPNKFTYEHVMRAFSKLEKVEDAEHLLKEMVDLKIPNSDRINQYILDTYSFAAIKDKRSPIEKKIYLDKSFKLLEQMKKEKNKISTFCLNSIFTLLINIEGIEEAKKKVFQMMHENGEKANARTYIIIMREYTQIENYAKAFEAFNEYKGLTTRRIIGFGFIAAIMTNNTEQVALLHTKASKLKFNPLSSILICLKSMNIISNNLLNALNKHFPSITESINNGNHIKNIEDLISLKSIDNKT